MESLLPKAFEALCQEDMTPRKEAEALCQEDLTSCKEVEALCQEDVTSCKEVEALCQEDRHCNPGCMINGWKLCAQSHSVGRG